jgi:hypothetical protein
LYVAAGGFHPRRILPCVIDVGTNNEKLINDPAYLGLKQPRLGKSRDNHTYFYRCYPYLTGGTVLVTGRILSVHKREIMNPDLLFIKLPSHQLPMLKGVGTLYRK